ncbi:hypothetical protein [Nonomuraea sp. B19D2]|uniref:hypothetical protein n=1 Tax=Nonomuraea sp. B19D2 TaxID=3159561 RepID=UPI0032DB3824
MAERASGRSASAHAVPLPQIPLDDPRVLALARASQQLAHDWHVSADVGWS